MGIEVLGQFAPKSKSRKVDFFTSSGTWTCPADVTQIELILGGGGGGGSRSDNNSSFGGGGGSGILEIVDVTPGQVYTIAIGSKGNNSFSSNGNTGGTSEFSVQGGATLVSASGGGGGSAGNSGQGFGFGGFGAVQTNNIEGTPAGKGYRGRSGGGGATGRTRGVDGGEGSGGSKGSSGKSGYCEIIYWTGE